MQREEKKWVIKRGRDTSCTYLLSHSQLFQMMMPVCVCKTVFPQRDWTAFGLPGIAQPSYDFSWLNISLKFKARTALNSHFIWFCHIFGNIYNRTTLKQGCTVNKFFQIASLALQRSIIHDSVRAEQAVVRTTKHVPSCHKAKNHFLLQWLTVEINMLITKPHRIMNIREKNTISHLCYLLCSCEKCKN